LEAGIEWHAYTRGQQSEAFWRVASSERQGVFLAMQGTWSCGTACLEGKQWHTLVFLVLHSAFILLH
jgi:aminoglycoside phosphotransferase